MTVSRQTPKVIYMGNGSARDWALTFPLGEESHLKLVLSSPENEITQIPQIEYKVNLSAGSVRYPLDGKDPLPNGWKIAVLRETPIEQGIDLVNNGGMFPEVLEGGLDKAAMIAQELEAKMARAVMVPETADDPVGFGKLILSGAERAESAAVRAESSAGSAGGNANAARIARDKAMEAQGKAEGAADRAEAEGVKAILEATKAEEISKGIEGFVNQASESAAEAQAAVEIVKTTATQTIEAANQANTAKNEAVTARGQAEEAKNRSVEIKEEIEAALDGVENVGVVSVNGKSGLVTLVPGDINAAPAVHSHSYPVTSVNGQTGDVVIATTGGGTGAGVSSVNEKVGDVTITGDTKGIATVVTNGNEVSVFVPQFPVTTVNGQTGDVVLPVGGASGVMSVNAMTGEVVLAANDIGAAPVDHTHGYPVTSINTKTGDVVLTAADIGAAAASHGHLGTNLWMSQGQAIILSQTVTAQCPVLLQMQADIGVFLRCTTQDQGRKADGDIVPFWSALSTGSAVQQVTQAVPQIYNMTTIGYRSGASLYVFDPNGDLFKVNPAKWQYVFRARF